MSLAFLLMIPVPAAAGAVASSVVPTAAEPAPSSSIVHYFAQGFYHQSIFPMLLITLALAWKARPCTQEAIPAGFKKFQLSYLAVWIFCVAADWFQGPYVYALYSAYGFSVHEIAQLFVAGFGSSLVFGCVVGTLADRFGRKKMCLAYCVFYIISCLTKHFKMYSVLMLGRVTGGIATSIVFSCFECWLVAEHCSRHKFSNGLLSYMFSLMFTTMYFTAIVAGLVAQAAADTFSFEPISEGSAIYMGGFCTPFDLAIVCLLIGIGLMLALWPENYGTEQQDDNAASAVDNIKNAGRLFVTDRNVALLCVIVACFEGSMYAFVFNWTPALESKDTSPPYGVIFALFMMACMCGSSAATLVGDILKPRARLTVTFSMGIAAFGIAAATGHQFNFVSNAACFVAFLLFEFCCGLYFPSIGLLKSEVVPEHIRGTMYNIYRMPLNAVVVCLLLSNISLIGCFSLCACLLALALVSTLNIKVAPGPRPELTTGQQEDLKVLSAKPSKQV